MNYYNYFTEIEEHFVRRRGKHMYVSPMDWSLIATWRESGVPLHVALRGIDIAMDTWHAKPHRGTDRLSTLFYCHDSVMAEFQRHLEAHLGEQSAESQQSPGEVSAKPAEKLRAELDKSEVGEFLGTRIREIKALEEKHPQDEDLARIVNRLKEISQSLASDEHPDPESLERDLGILDELLVNCLKDKVRAEESESWETEAKTELKVYKKRLPKETYGKILDNFLRGKIHRKFGVGDLSLFQL